MPVFLSKIISRCAAVLAVATALAVSACEQTAPTSTATIQQPSQGTQNLRLGEYRVAPGDRLRVVVLSDAELSGEYEVDSTGMIAPRMAGRVVVLGMSTPEIETLLGLWRNRRRSSKDVKRIATEHAADLQRRIDEMRAMQRTLQHLAHCCHGDDRPDCPILDDLAGGRSA